MLAHETNISALSSRLLVARAGRQLPLVSLERFRVDLPVKTVVRTPRKDAPRGIEFHDLSPHREALVLGAVPVGVVEESLCPIRLPALAHRAPPLSVAQGLRECGIRADT
jgi:hypothetical protein